MLVWQRLWARASNWAGGLRTCSLMHPVERACEIGSGVGSANKDGGLRERKRTKKQTPSCGSTAAEEQQTSRQALVKCRLVLHAPMTSGRRPCCPLPPAAPGCTAGKLIRARPASAGRAPTWTSASLRPPTYHICRDTWDGEQNGGCTIEVKAGRGHRRARRDAVGQWSEG